MAKRCETALAAAFGKCVEQGNDEPRAGRADRMAERDRAAVHVETFARHAELAFKQEGAQRKGFVVLEQVDVAELQAAARKHLAGGRDRRLGEAPGRAGGPGAAEDFRDGLEAALLDGAGACEDERGGSV